LAIYLAARVADNGVTRDVLFRLASGQAPARAKTHHGPC